MENFTDLEKLIEVKKYLPNGIKGIRKIEVEPKQIRVFGKTKNGLDFVFDLIDKRAPLPNMHQNISPNIELNLKQPPF